MEMMKGYLQILLNATMSQLWMYSLLGSEVKWSSIRLSILTKSSTIVIMIDSFLIPATTVTSLAVHPTQEVLVTDGPQLPTNHIHLMLSFT
jgi:hypothetical protein